MPNRLPHVSEGLLEFLAKSFPDKLPHGVTVPSQVETARLMGQQDVMRKLRQVHHQQDPLKG